MAITTARPDELAARVTAPMSYWRTVAWRLARDPATLVAGAVLVLIVLSIPARGRSGCAWRRWARPGTCWAPTSRAATC